MKNDKIQCPICKNWYHNLTGKHLQKHGYNSVKQFLLDYPNSKTISNRVSKILSKHWHKKLKPMRKEIGRKSSETKKERFKLGLLEPWNKGLTKETDKRIKKNGESVSNTWKRKSKREKKKYGKVVSKRLKGRSWKDLWGEEQAEIRSEKQSKRLKGKGSPFYKDGRCSDKLNYINDYGPNWPKIRKAIYKRDNWTCQECLAKDRKVLCHHIIDYFDFPVEKRKEFAHHGLNLITLCFSCHSKLINKKILKVNTVRYLEITKSKYLVTTTYSKATLSATYNMLKSMMI